MSNLEKSGICRDNARIELNQQITKNNTRKL